MNSTGEPTRARIRVSFDEEDVTAIVAKAMTSAAQCADRVGRARRWPAAWNWFASCADLSLNTPNDWPKPPPAPDIVRRSNRSTAEVASAR